MMKRPPASPGGLVIVDKPQGLTSHDVVARIRRMAGTSRVGHAGTLDPMATGVLVVGVERATRMLTYLVGADKEYEATIRLGVGTVTDDRDGSVTWRPGAQGLAAEAIETVMAGLRGTISQVPSAVSAVKVDGRRAYDRVRSGENVVLKAREITVKRFDVVDRDDTVDDETPVIDLSVSVVCSSGTYVRALARDLGSALGTAGHLTELRRIRVGPYHVQTARELDDLAEAFAVLPIADAARAAFPARELSADEARRLAHGQRLDASEQGPGPIAAFAPDGSLVALVCDAGLTARPLVVLAG